MLWTRSFTGMVNLAGSYQQRVSVLAPPTDFDGDGRRDLLVGHSEYEGHLGLPRTRFETLSGATGRTAAVYAAGVGTWGGFAMESGPIRQLPLAVAVPDFTGDCLADVAVTVARQRVVGIAAFPGKGGAPAWHAELTTTDRERLVEFRGARLDTDSSGDVLVGLGIPGHPPASGSEVASTRCPAVTARRCGPASSRRTCRRSPSSRASTLAPM